MPTTPQTNVVPQTIELMNGKTLVAILGAETMQNFGTPTTPEFYHALTLVHPLQIVCSGSKFLFIKFPFMRTTDAVQINFEHVITMTPAHPEFAEAYFDKITSVMMERNLLEIDTPTMSSAEADVDVRAIPDKPKKRRKRLMTVN